MMQHPLSAAALGLSLAIALGSLPGFTAPALAAPSAEDYRQQGLTYREQGRLDEAIAALQTSVELAPDQVSGQVILGWTQHLAGQQEAAAQTLINAFYDDPFAVPTLNALGIVYLVQGRLDYAVATHAWAATLNAENEIAYFNLSLALHRLESYDWAIATATRAAELEPDNPHPWVALAIAQWSQGNPQAAEQAYDAAIALRGWFATGDIRLDLEQAAFSPDQIAIAQHLQDLHTP